MDILYLRLTRSCAGTKAGNVPVAVFRGSTWCSWLVLLHRLGCDAPGRPGCGCGWTRCCAGTGTSGADHAANPAKRLGRLCTLSARSESWYCAGYERTRPGATGESTANSPPRNKPGGVDGVEDPSQRQHRRGPRADRAQVGGIPPHSGRRDGRHGLPRHRQPGRLRPYVSVVIGTPPGGFGPAANPQLTAAWAAEAVRDLLIHI